MKKRAMMSACAGIHPAPEALTASQESPTNAGLCAQTASPGLVPGSAREARWRVFHPGRLPDSPGEPAKAPAGFLQACPRFAPPVYFQAPCCIARVLGRLRLAI